MAYSTTPKFKSLHEKGLRLFNHQSLTGKTGQGFRLVIVNVKDGQQFCDGHQLAETLRQMNQFNFSAFVSQGYVACNKLAQPARIDMTDTGKVQQNLGFPLFNQDTDCFVQRNGAAANSHPTFQIENSHISRPALIDVQVYHLALPESSWIRVQTLLDVDIYVKHRI